MSFNNDDDNDATRIDPRIKKLQSEMTVLDIPTAVRQTASTIVNVSDGLLPDSSGNAATWLSSTNPEEKASQVSAPSLKIGSVLKNRFILREVLGHGGMGTVFRATDIIRQEARDKSPDVAIKVLNEEFKHNPGFFIALQRETKKTLELAHPNIITVYDFDRDGDNFFMVMEILKGQTLTQYIKDCVPTGTPFKKAWPIIQGLALALAYAHKRNIVHSDFKPGNVFIKENGEVKVLDFGIANAIQRSDQQSNETIFNAKDLGALTPAYASLEMYENQTPDPRDDLYALACVTYELLSGKHPFGKLSALKALELNLQPPPIPGLKRRQWKALTHALAFKRAQRTNSISKFIDEIEPRSIPPVIISISAIALLVAAGSYSYVYFNADPLADRVISLTPVQQQKINDLLELAQIHYDVGFITAPTGSNALWAYRQVLEVDPYNKSAKKGLEKIADLSEEQATKLYEENHIDESLAKIEEGLEAIPKHEGLLALKSKIVHQETK